MTCKLCERTGVEITDHHLIPVTRHKNKKTKRETIRAERHKTADICLPCHNQIHALFTEKQLEREYNTIEKLKAHPEIIKFVTWISKRNFGKMQNSSSK